jgi:predicted ATPase/class 3 adenylate cyclase
MSGQPPSGTVTFMLTDLEGSTRMWEENPQAMKTAMVRHDELLEKAITSHRGFVFSRMGDGMATSFATAGDAIAAATAFKQALAEEDWRTGSPLKARIGLHTAEAVIIDDTGYANLPINRCARLMAAALGGQIVISGATESLVRDQLPDGAELVDLGEHRLRDLGNPMRIFQLNRAGRPEEFPPLRSLDSFPGNLPAQVSSFIGRQVDASRVAAALDASRVVTITGVGGVGKTRLASHVAADLLPRYPDGAWLVELAPVREPDRVVETVAAVFHVTNRSGPIVEDALIDVLAQKRLLLVLDNCEHLLATVAQLVARIERSCPGVVVLATSREGMAVEGEQLIALPPLQSGKPNADIDNLVQTDAVKLFVERARLVKADFALTDSNARAVVEVCQRLDGVPLAIELAAARVIALSPAELAKRLDRRFQVLAGGRRGAVERHATLRAAIDWSYELLTEAEQRLLARMSVFSGGCTLDAVEEICSGDPVARDDVLDFVTGLVARSLVIAEDSVLGTRYRLLETIRQYSEERLAGWGETDMLLIGHARFFADLSAMAAEHSYGPEQLRWIRQLNLDRDNIRFALAHAIDTGDAALAVQLVAHHPHQERSESPTGELFSLPASPVLGLPGATSQPGYPLVLLVAAYDAQSTGDWDVVHQLCRQALEAERNFTTSRHGGRIEMDTCNLQAQAALCAGAYEDANWSYRRAAELAVADGFPGLAAIFLSYTVDCGLLGGATDEEVMPTAEESVALARQSGMPGAIALSLASLALTLVERDPARARALLRECVELSSTPGEEISTGLLLACLVAGRLQEWGLTLALTGRTLALWRWSISLMQFGPCLALCARSFAEVRPEVACVLRAAAYSAFRRISPSPGSTQEPQGTPVDSRTNHFLAALRETGDLVATSLSDARRRELRAEGAAMSTSEAITFVVANIDPKLLRGPIPVAQV